MIRSMTAFAGSETTIGIYTINCELRSVNHRYCDIFLRIPDRFRFVEADIRAALGQQIKRGKIECSISYTKQQTDSHYFSVNQQAVRALLRTTGEIERLMDHPRSFSALDVLMFPGIQQEPEFEAEQLTREINRLIEEALVKLLAVREREGAQLGRMIEQRCAKMRPFIASARQRLPEVTQNLRAKLTTRLNELLADPDFDRLEQELVFLTQKLDIDEELDRLDTHIDEVLRVIGQNEPVGRRLDFLMQEMNREANTLGSKSADKELTQMAIELKVLIEQMREQVQNIE